MKQFVVLKTTPQAARWLRFVAALTREHQYRVLERLLKAEANRIVKEKCG
jgi:hypothetical protein